MRMLILGATGGTGSALVTQALERGDTVTVLARHPERVQQRHERLQVVAGDVLQPAALATVMHGQDAVLSALGTQSVRAPITLYSVGTRNIIDAMGAADITRLLCIASIGVSHDPHLPGWYRRLVVPVLHNIYDDMTLMEHAVHASALTYTIVRPGFLTNGPRTGTYRIGEAVTPRRGWRVARADLAECMLNAVHHATFLRATISVVY